FDIAIPFEFKKTKDHRAKNNVCRNLQMVILNFALQMPLHQNEQRMIWGLHHIMCEDPLCCFALGITIKDTEMRTWYSSHTFLAVLVPIDFT
ncbi:hypothetical protein J3R82DRAFT_8708, partial [Butyriboletus roseoflavus]